MNNYSEILKSHNLKVTPQRLVIMESIFLSGHINIDKLYEEVKDKFSSISLATIYKNINAMTEKLLLVEVKLPNKKSVYELVKTEHSHLLCKKCGFVEDIAIDTDNMIKSINSVNFFKIVQTDIIISGLCIKCQ